MKDDVSNTYIRSPEDKKGRIPEPLRSVIEDHQSGDVVVLAPGSWYTSKLPPEFEVKTCDCETPQGSSFCDDNY